MRHVSIAVTMGNCHCHVENFCYHLIYRLKNLYDDTSAKVPVNNTYFQEFKFRMEFVNTFLHLQRTRDADDEAFYEKQDRVTGRI